MIVAVERAPAAATDSERVETRHLLFVVCHVTFTTAYSVAVTFTVLLLLLTYFNKCVRVDSLCSKVRNMFGV